MNGEDVVRLATYGTLSPGRANHHELAGLAGTWRRGTVRGQLAENGWGASTGYPAIVLAPDGPDVDVYVFESRDLAAHWARLDEFEGEGYRRVLTRVRTEDGTEIEAWIYEGVVDDA